MKILISTSMPRIIPSTTFGLNSEADIKAKFEKLNLMANKRRIMFRVKHAELFSVKDDEGNYIFAVDTQTQTLAYYIEYVTYPVGTGHDAVTQVALWRDRSLLSSTGMAKAVFFSYLLPKFKILMSDTLQTDDGKHFWWSRMAEALDSGKFCYGYDRMAHELIQIDASNYKWALTKYWGTEADYETKLVLISERKLSIGAA